MRFRVSLFMIILVSLLSLTPVHAQWASDWTSSAISVNAISAGWLAFQQNGSQWEYRFYVLDSTSFKIMQSEYSTTPQYTYTFNAAEIFAGYSIYSLETDLNGDGIVDFYTLSDYGTTTLYRQAFRVFDITSNSTIFERNNSSQSYSYPTIWDADNDGLLECTFSRADYPSGANPIYESYNTGITSVSPSNPALPMGLDLRQNYPNPFNSSTNIGFKLSSPSRVKLDVYDILGQKVSTLTDGIKNAGSHSIQWNGRTQNGETVSSGSYFYRLSVDDKPLQTKKMILVR